MTGRFRPALPAALLTVLALAACGGGPPSARSQTGATPPAAASESGAPPRIALTSPNAPVVAPRDLPTPQRMIGMTSHELERLLGEPGFRRRDDPAEIWQYRGTSCLLDVFLYREKDGIKVSHVDVRGLSVVKVAGEECILDVLKSTRKGAAG